MVGDLYYFTLFLGGEFSFFCEFFLEKNLGKKNVCFSL